MSHKSSMHGGGESSDCIVPAKCANKGGEPSAERMGEGGRPRRFSSIGPMLDTVPDNIGNSSTSGVRAVLERAGRAFLQGGNRVR